MVKNKLKENNGIYIHKEKEYHNHLKIIHNELMKYRTINIPNQNIIIKNQELEDWIVEKLSPKEIAEIICPKKILLFGGDFSSDCGKLTEKFLRNSSILPLLSKDFSLVSLW